ncbi:MAG: oxygen-independent coproporphyrinogen III oxidase [Myxococcales bacterium]|nr:oxygen-independent coproporphyrinogen III oxidase [Myxococcales bacterium]
MQDVASLVAKYATAGPRYTSYPTVPYWESEGFSPAAWQARLVAAVGTLPSPAPISIYVHLPYCESLCTFCGCNRQITKKHDVEGPYIEALLTEWAAWRAALPEVAIAELHFGGGTPSFFAPARLAQLVDGLQALATPLAAAECEYSFEGHPGNTTRAHLEALGTRGFRRVSFGVQDYAPAVQQAIHRVQSPAQVRGVTQTARELGYTSVSHDLVYGLPKQTLASLRETIATTIALRPDRIAFYSYAHVPWIGNTGQRGFSEADLPTPAQKLELFCLGRELFMAAGYEDIGMDHFALPGDDLARATRGGTLHRNFMGYTTRRTEVMLGLGASSISDCGTAFAQNEKTVADYMALVQAGTSPVVRGHLLTDDDVVVRRHILALMCQGTATYDPSDWPAEMRADIEAGLRELVHDDLVRLESDVVNITPAGRTFLRNICMLFDRRLHAAPTAARFSATV